MKSFSIRELENLTGIKSHTIRCWEQRYKVLHPQRTDGNVRWYSIEELQKIILVANLNKNGYKISCLAKFSIEELQCKTNQLTGNEQRLQRAINNLIIFMYRIDTDNFEMELNDCCLTWPADVVVQNIIYPFLKTIHLLNQGNRLSEEHFVVTTVRKKLCWCIERTGTAESHHSILLFLPDQKQLDLLLLYIHYILKKEGWKVFYLGNDVSLKNLLEIFPLKKPDYLLSYFSGKNSFSFEDCSSLLKEVLPHSKFLVVNTASVSFPQPNFKNIMAMNLEDMLLHLSQEKKSVQFRNENVMV